MIVSEKTGAHGELDLYTVTELASKLRKTPAAVRTMMSRGKLRPEHGLIYVDGTPYFVKPTFDQAALDGLLAHRRKKRREKPR